MICQTCGRQAKRFDYERDLKKETKTLCWRCYQETVGQQHRRGEIKNVKVTHG